MNERGIALLTAMWLAALVAALVGTAMLESELALKASRNRIALARGQWAVEGCLAYLQARAAAREDLGMLQRVDLGPDAWCAVAAENPASRLNLNLASRSMLMDVLQREALVDALIDWRDADSLQPNGLSEGAWYRRENRPGPRDGELVAVGELALVRGFDDSVRARLAGLFTVTGSGRLDLNSAPEAVLATLPGMAGTAARAVTQRRQAGKTWSGLEELYHAVSPGTRARIAGHYQELSASLDGAGEPILFHLVGRVDGSPVEVRVDVLAHLVGARLAVLRVQVL